MESLQNKVRKIAIDLKNVKQAPSLLSDSDIKMVLDNL